jgi:hypothetical protein
MADQNGSATLKENVQPAGVESKGKGKAVAEPDAMDVDESSEEDDEGDEVSHWNRSVLSKKFS